MRVGEIPGGCPNLLGIEIECAVAMAAVDGLHGLLLWANYGPAGEHSRIKVQAALAGCDYWRGSQTSFHILIFLSTPHLLRSASKKKSEIKGNRKLVRPTSE